MSEKKSAEELAEAHAFNHAPPRCDSQVFHAIREAFIKGHAAGLAQGREEVKSILRGTEVLREALAVEWTKERNSLRAELERLRGEKK
jgi:hypothetical protein